jgi:hypothetical protein
MKMQACWPSRYKNTNLDTNAEWGQFTAGIETVNMAVPGRRRTGDR